MDGGPIRRSRHARHRLDRERRPARGAAGANGLRNAPAAGWIAAGTQRFGRHGFRSGWAPVPHAGGGLPQDCGAELTATADGFEGLRVLVVEDETLIAMLVEDLLTDMGCEVVAVAASVSQALTTVSAPESHIEAA